MYNAKRIKRPVASAFMEENDEDNEETKREIEKYQQSKQNIFKNLVKEKQISQEPVVSDTNTVFVLNLHPSVTRDDLMYEFGRFGDIGSVLMLEGCCSVAFMNKKGSKQAMEGMQGHMFHGKPVTLCWGQETSLPPVPLFVHPMNKDVPTTKSNGQLIQVVEPPIARRRIIHRVIEWILSKGPSFLDFLVTNRTHEFDFLYNKSDEYVYFTWKMYALIQGDDKDDWRTESFLMTNNSSRWNPPIPKQNCNTDSSESEPEGPHSRYSFDDFKSHRLNILLHNLTTDRSKIADAMLFCLKHASAYEDIIKRIRMSICRSKAPMIKKLARIYLVSDILYNSAAPVANAWNYQKIEKDLELLFRALKEDLAKVQPLMKQEMFKSQLVQLVKVWDTWSLISQSVLDNLYELLDQRKKQEEIIAIDETQIQEEETCDHQKRFKPLSHRVVPLDAWKWVMKMDFKVVDIDLIDPELDGIPMK